MSSVRLRPLFASSSFRLSAIYGIILVVAFVLGGAGVWIATRSAAENEIRQRVQLEMDALQREIRSEGLQAAVAAIQTRADIPGSLEYRFVDKTGRLLAGDLMISRPRIGWSSIRYPENPREAGDDSFLALTAPAPNGGLLTIGDNLERAEQVRVAVLRTLLWVGASALALAIVAGVIATRTALRRIDDLSRTMARVGGGDLTARAPESRRGDDIAQLGRGVNQMLARLTLLIADIRRVSTDIAHDLRTPLAQVRLQLETAAQAPDLPAAQDAARLALAKTDDVLRVFAAILRLAEIDSGAARTRFAPVDLSALAERVADAYRPDVEAGGHVLTLDPIEPCAIAGDADLLAQALANLLENAMRHTPSGTPIVLRLYASDSGARLEVEDKGPGIPPLERDRMLEPFARLDRSRSMPGAGLGLSIVSAIARLHGARLQLADAGPGLLVVLELPVASH